MLPASCHCFRPIPPAVIALANCVEHRKWRHIHRRKPRVHYAVSVVHLSISQVTQLKATVYELAGFHCHNIIQREMRQQFEKMKLSWKNNCNFFTSHFDFFCFSYGCFAWVLTPVIQDNTAVSTGINGGNITVQQNNCPISAHVHHV